MAGGSRPSASELPHQRRQQMRKHENECTLRSFPNPDAPRLFREEIQSIAGHTVALSACGFACNYSWQKGVYSRERLCFLSRQDARSDRQCRAKQGSCQVKNIPLHRHLIARRFWHPLSRAVSFIERPILQICDWLLTKRRLEDVCFKSLSPMIRFRCWIVSKRSQQRPVQLFRPSSLAYDIAAIGAALLAPFARLHRRCCDRMILETDPRIRKT